jgi:hypothetical protein
VTVDLATIRYSDPKRGKRYIMLTPAIAQEALLRFDQGDETLKPFDFRLPPAAQVVDAAKKAKDNAKKRREAGDVSPTGKAKRKESELNSRGVKVDGATPPLGALAGGPGLTGQAATARIRTGRIRAWGLRSMAR